MSRSSFQLFGYLSTIAISLAYLTALSRNPGNASGD
jgi:hypothetical protein